MPYFGNTPVNLEAVLGRAAGCTASPVPGRHRAPHGDKPGRLPSARRCPGRSARPDPRRTASGHRDPNTSPSTRAGSSVRRPATASSRESVFSYGQKELAEFPRAQESISSGPQEPRLQCAGVERSLRISAISPRRKIAAEGSSPPSPPFRCPIVTQWASGLAGGSRQGLLRS